MEKYLRPAKRIIIKDMADLDRIKKVEGLELISDDE
jgi:hypothetical protein